MRVFLFVFSLLIASLASGCSQQLIPNTDVEDTAENRKVVQFCEQYRRAVERREIGILFSLAHPKYYENGGNIDSSDDIDHAGLKEFLRDRFNGTRAIRYEIRYRRVKAGPNNTIWVDYTYSASYKIPKDGEQAEDPDDTGANGEWHRQVADNRLELLPHKDTFLILSGM